MSQSTSELKRTSRYIFSGFLLALGLIVIFGWVSLSPSEVWFPWMLTIMGLLIFFVPIDMRRQVGVTIGGLGLYLLFRQYELVTLPVLQYILGSFLVLVGAVNIVRNSRGGEVALKQTFAKANNDKPNKE